MRFIFPMLFFLADAALATQTHGDPEGLYVHQFSHIFFIFSMGIFIYWLRSRKLARERGWKYIQYASLFFILWSLDAFFTHYLDEQTRLIRAVSIDAATLEIRSDSPLLIMIYYGVKLDHLLLVPAIVLFYLGLKQLSRKDSPAKESGDFSK